MPRQLDLAHSSITFQIRRFVSNMDAKMLKIKRSQRSLALDERR